MKKSVMMSKVAMVVLASCFTAGSTGCMAAAGSGDEESMVTVTSVHLAADGAPRVQQTMMTLAQERAESLAREQHLVSLAAARTSGLGQAVQALSLDSGCAGASLWLFDASHNRICFDGAGAASLYSFADGSGTWAGQVTEFWPGSEDGYLYDRRSDIPDFENFSAWQSLTTAVFGFRHDTVVLTD
jgi:hypothetical protein